jgi:hypothetical protein
LYLGSLAALVGICFLVFGSFTISFMAGSFFIGESFFSTFLGADFGLIFFSISFLGA